MGSISTAASKKPVTSFSAIHAELGPVQRYAQWCAQLKSDARIVVTIPEGSAAYNMGHRYVSIPDAEREHYLANGATLAWESGN